MEFDSDDTEIDTEIASTIDSRAGSTLPIVTGHLGKSTVMVQNPGILTRCLCKAKIHSKSHKSPSWISQYLFEDFVCPSRNKFCNFLTFLF